jgi:hypothetical protein
VGDGVLDVLGGYCAYPGKDTLIINSAVGAGNRGPHQVEPFIRVLSLGAPKIGRGGKIKMAPFFGAFSPSLALNHAAWRPVTF